MIVSKYRPTTIVDWCLLHLTQPPSPITNTESIYDTSNVPVMENEIAKEIVIELKNTANNSESLVANFEDSTKKIWNAYQYVGKQINHRITIAFKKYNYTTLIIFESIPDKWSNEVNRFDKHSQIFVDTKKIDSNTKIITSKGKLFEQPK